MGSSHSGISSPPLVRIRHCRNFLGTAAAWKLLQLLRHEHSALIPAPAAVLRWVYPQTLTVKARHKGGNESLDFACSVAPKLECSPGCAGRVCGPVTTFWALPDSKPRGGLGIWGREEPGCSTSCILHILQPGCSSP